jgi:hypothetical protein
LAHEHIKTKNDLSHDDDDDDDYDDDDDDSVWSACCPEMSCYRNSFFISAQALSKIGILPS